jgi:hypothetical protein
MENQNTETDQGIYVPNEDAATEIPYTGLMPCPKCNKVFKNAVALRMHDIRKHQGRDWSTTANFHKGKKKANREFQKRIRRAYQKRLRARYKLQGRDSRGYPKEGGNKGMTLPKWSPERLAKFKRTMRNKAKARARRIQIVYPEPGKVSAIATWTEKKSVDVIPPLKYCPNCGEHIEGWRKQP